MSTLPLDGPKFRAFDSNGDPLSGGKLYSYAAGTMTPLNTFTTWAGTVANSNPVVLDANGEADVWTTPGLLYKFVLKDSLDVIQWTVDNYPSGAGASSGGGGSTTDLAVAMNPGGRLSVSSGNPIVTADVLDATTVLYVNYLHNTVPLYDGSSWTLHTFTAELSQGLGDTSKSPAAAVPGGGYDLFIWNDAGTLRLSRGPAWSSPTVRGTGAGTTDLERVGGRWVNRYTISNGPGAQRGLYVGSIHVGSVGVTDSMGRRHVWNAYNRVERPMLTRDSASTWTYQADAWRQANGNASNSIEVVIGLPGEAVEVEVLALAQHITPNVRSTIGIGIDSAVANAASVYSAGYCETVTQNELRLLSAKYRGYPGIGWHYITWLERSEPTMRVPPNTPNVTTWHGIDNTMPANSGIFGHVWA